MSKDGLKAKSMVRDVVVDIGFPIKMDDGLTPRRDAFARAKKSNFGGDVRASYVVLPVISLKAPWSSRSSLANRPQKCGQLTN
jgi:hypothetical protein